MPYWIVFHQKNIISHWKMYFYTKIPNKILRPIFTCIKGLFTPIWRGLMQKGGPEIVRPSWKGQGKGGIWKKKNPLDFFSGKIWVYMISMGLMYLFHGRRGVLSFPFLGERFLNFVFMCITPVYNCLWTVPKDLFKGLHTQWCLLQTLLYKIIGMFRLHATENSAHAFLR